MMMTYTLELLNLCRWKIHIEGLVVYILHCRMHPNYFGLIEVLIVSYQSLLMYLY